MILKTRVWIQLQSWISILNIIRKGNSVLFHFLYSTKSRLFSFSLSLFHLYIVKIEFRLVYIHIGHLSTHLLIRILFVDLLLHVWKYKKEFKIFWELWLKYQKKILNRNCKNMKWKQGFSGTCIKDTWTKPKEGRIEGGRWGWLGWGGWKWRQLYSNNNKKNLKTQKTNKNYLLLRSVRAT